MGRIHQWARLASVAPRLANAAMRAPGLGALTKQIAGIAAERSLPPFASPSFTDWFRARRAPPRQGGRKVLLWPDTFNNYFRPATAIAATKVLEAIGCEVTIPKASVCCGRPLYDWGWLDRAKRLWTHTMTVLRDEIEAGTPVIGLEPACVSTFKDELTNLFPKDPAAGRLSAQTVFFSDFVAGHADGLDPRSPKTKNLVQLHCHQHAVLKDDGERALLERLGLDHEILQSGCCGMAGAFGFEAEKYEVAMRIGERVLLPRVRSAPEETRIIANGFSCREQIEQATGRKTLHIAEIAAGLLH
jgi:Fe-S oxidoreductase